jgi:hypothetical protein
MSAPRIVPAPAEASASDEPRVVRQVAIVVGSARPRGASTSELLGRRLLGQFVQRGLRGVVVHAHLLRTDPRGLDAFGGCDLLVLATPLYFDALPSHVVELLARLAAARRAAPRVLPMALAAIVNGGTPDPRQGETAIAMCALAARDAELAWRGGLAFGEGEAIGAAQASAEARQQLDAALGTLAHLLADGGTIATGLTARPVMPERGYTFLRNASWLVAARRNKVLLRLADRPMAQP